MEEIIQEVAQNMTQVQYDTLELQIRKDQMGMKKEFSTPFNQAIREFLDMCFMMPKEKRENFIIREKLTTMIYKIVRSQKKFKDPKNIFDNIRYLAVYDKETNEIGKLFNINVIQQTVEYLTYYDKLNGYDMKTKHFRDIYLFDYNSPQLAALHSQYISNNKGGLNLVNMVHFLDDVMFNKVDEPIIPKGYGVELVRAVDHPAMQQVMMEYKIPEEIVKKPKRKLQKLDSGTMILIEEFESVKDAEAQTKISASTISNVLCGGFSARNYLVAGGFKWQYSTEFNKKYYLNSMLGKEYNAMKSNNEDHKKTWDNLMLDINDELINKWAENSFSFNIQK